MTGPAHVGTYRRGISAGEPDNQDMRKLAAGSAALFLCLLVTGPTSALAAQEAPSRVSSEPEPREELHEAPEKVSITFDQPLDPSSFIAVENHCGDRVDDKQTEVTANEMEIDLTSKVSGNYHVEYYAKGIAGVTGANTDSFMFIVHGGPSCDPGDGGGHGKHGNGNGHGKGGHNQHGTGHSGNGEHEGTNPGDGTTHSGTGHTDDHDTMTGDHDAVGAEHDQHEAADDDKRGEHEGREENGIQNIAFGPAGPPLRGPDGPAVVIALSLSLVLGVLGGTVLRISAPK